MPVLIMGLITFGKVLLMGVNDFKFWAVTYTFCALQVLTFAANYSMDAILPWSLVLLPAYILLLFLAIVRSKQWAIQ
jgi:hypothetical protein